MMKALVLTAVKTLEVKTAPRPIADDNTVVVRVLASGICGSDLLAFLEHDPQRPPPLTLGHEAAGVIVGGTDAGRRVVINPLITCEKCEDCLAGRTNLCVHRQVISMPPRDGTFAEFVAVPKQNLVTVPDDVPFTKAALTKSIACGWHAARMCHVALNRPLGNLQCLVFGGGATGVGAALALAAVGVKNITLVESNPQLRVHLQEIPTLRAIDITDPKMLTPGSAQIVIDSLGTPSTRKDACNFAAPGGVIAQVGIGKGSDGLDAKRMALHEIQFIGCYSFTTGDFKATAQAIFQGQLGTLDWVETRPLSEGQSAFEDLIADDAAHPKIMLIP